MNLNGMMCNVQAVMQSAYALQSEMCRRKWNKTLSEPEPEWKTNPKVYYTHVRATDAAHPELKPATHSTFIPDLWAQHVLDTYWLPKQIVSQLEEAQRAHVALFNKLPPPPAV